MKRRHFLHTAGLCGVGLALRHTAEAQQGNSTSTGRFLEVERLSCSQWHDNRRGSVVRMAMEAAGAGRSEAYDRPFDDMAAAGLAAAVSRGFGHGDAAIRRLLDQMDPWSSYLSPPEWRQYNASLHADYSGVGMDLEKEKDGSFTCWPYPGSVAEAAGVKAGAKLLSVDNRPVEDMSLYAIGALVRGRRGTPVQLGVSRFLGLSSNLNIIRTPAHSQTVFPAEARNGVQTLRISRFSSSTPAELSRMIAAGTPTVELDLTGCRGGDLDAAVEAASLFLNTGSRVGSIARTGDGETLRASVGRKIHPFLILHQDGDTASAAEVFVAGLVQNRVASSYGGTSRGKATTQDIITLDNGGALVLTTGLIYGPDGRTWQNTGLKPSR